MPVFGKLPFRGAPHMHKVPSWLGGALALLACTAASAQDRGLLTSANALGGASWQARFERDGRSPVSDRGLLSLGLPTVSQQTLRLMGDYQFSTFRLGDTGGLRLTGGLLINLRASSNVNGSGSTSDSAAALPYAGIGYASGDSRGAWGFSADLGLAAQGLGPARLDRLLGGAGNLGVDGQARLLPVLRLGMSVAF
jgi:hypothetical protein